MKRITIVAAAILTAAPAYAGFFQSVSVDENGVTNTTTVRTPDAPPPPPPPIFGRTVATKHKDNGNTVVITTTYRDGVQISRERSVTRGGGNGHRGR